MNPQKNTALTVIVVRRARAFPGSIMSGLCVSTIISTPLASGLLRLHWRSVWMEGIHTYLALRLSRS